MSTKLYREFEIKSLIDFRRLKDFIRKAWAAIHETDFNLLIVITTTGSVRTLPQNARLWGFLYKYLAQQAWVDGRQYSDKVWHEFLCEKFAGNIDFKLPDGTVKTRRKSTADMDVKEFSDYMQQVEVYAVQEHGIRYPERFYRVQS